MSKENESTDIGPEVERSAADEEEAEWFRRQYAADEAAPIGADEFAGLEGVEESAPEPLIAETTEDEVVAWHQRYGGSWQEAHNAVNKQHLREAIQRRVYESPSLDGALYNLAAIVDTLIERTYPR